MSVYAKESPQRLNRALRSIWHEQIRKPDQIVLVEDGPLPRDLKDVIKDFQNNLKEKMYVVRLPLNRGLGPALQEGLKKCRYDLIARMDSDDVAVADRFVKQLEIFANKDIDICGSWVGEFEEDQKKIVSIRKVPENHDEIVKFAKWRSPMNHPSVMFRKKSVLDIGGYRAVEGFEDYDLWMRMLLAGYRFYNYPDILVNMHSDKMMMHRRRGLSYISSEIYFWREAKRLGFVNDFEMIRNIVLRILPRCFPVHLLHKIYRSILRSNV